MNKQIDINDNPLDSSQTDKLSVAQKGGGTMVVGMKEGQGLLLEEQEDGIEKFEVLGQIVELSLCQLASTSSLEVRRSLT